MAHFYLADDPPQNAPGRVGTSRRRVDIEFERGGDRGIRPRLHFEAKRLYQPGSVTAYLGEEGLALFIDGEYAVTEDIGGMIGYVQLDAPAVWIERIREGLSTARVRLGFRLPPGLVKHEPDTYPTETHKSHHDRPSVGRPIMIYHTFLQF